jgi:hypothetical protein
LEETSKEKLTSAVSDRRAAPESDRVLGNVSCLAADIPLLNQVSERPAARAHRRSRAEQRKISAATAD